MKTQQELAQAEAARKADVRQKIVCGALALRFIEFNRAALGNAFWRFIDRQNLKPDDRRLFDSIRGDLTPAEGVEAQRMEALLSCGNARFKSQQQLADYLAQTPPGELSDDIDREIAATLALRFVQTGSDIYRAAFEAFTADAET